MGMMGNHVILEEKLQDYNGWDVEISGLKVYNTIENYLLKTRRRRIILAVPYLKFS